MGLRPPRRLRSLLAPASLVGLALFTYGWRLTTSDWLVDETTYARAGRAYLDGHLGLNLEHPPLAKYLFGLAQQVHPGLLAVRLVAALCGLVLTALVYLALTHLAGRRWAQVGTVLWLVLPHGPGGPPGSPGGVVQLDRFAMLDVVATTLGMLALVLAWRWAQQPGLGAALLVGAVWGLAVGAKLPALLLGPALAGAVLLPAVRPPSRLLLRQAGGACAAAVTSYLLLFAPQGGNAWRAALQPVSRQLGHAETGHAVLLAGSVHVDAPWWAHLYYAWHDNGPLVACLTGVLLLAAVALHRPRRVLAPLWLAVLVPLVVLSLSPVALPYYSFLWAPPVVVLAALGLRALWDRQRRLGALAVLLVGVVGAQHLWALATTQPGPYARMGCALDTLHPPHRLVVVKGYPAVLRQYAPRDAVLGRFPRDLRGELLVVDRDVLRRFPDLRTLDVAAQRGFLWFDDGPLALGVASSVLSGDTGAAHRIAVCGLRRGSAPG